MKIYHFLCFFLLVGAVKGQDIIFSQHQIAQLIVNPAFNGLYQGQYRLSLQYKDQGNSFLLKDSYRAFAASGELSLNILENDNVSFGIIAMENQAGASALKQSSYNFNVAYLKKLSANTFKKTGQFLSFGSQFGIGQNRLNMYDLWFGNQYDIKTGAIDPGIPNGESILESKQFFDLSSGLLWYWIADKKFSLTAGLAFYHLNRPNISLIAGETVKKYIRQTGIIAGTFYISDGISLHPAILYYKQGPHSAIIVGSNLRYEGVEAEDVAVSLGIWSRSGRSGRFIQLNSIIISSLISFGQWQFGFSYDITTSDLRSADGSKGGFEFSMQYFGGQNDRQKPLKCPVF